MHYLMIYELEADYMHRRGEFRAEHLSLARAAVARGEMVLGGALADPTDQAIMLFKAESPDVVHAFARADPYVLNGLVKRWSVRPWTTVVGDLAEHSAPL